MSLKVMMPYATSTSVSLGRARTAARRQAAFRTLQAECSSWYWLANWPLDCAWLLGPSGRSTGLI
eukprot:4475387-Alexandrium_andersonii.AAC.1